MSDDNKVVMSEVSDLLKVVPSFLGFPPKESLVVIALGPSETTLGNDAVKLLARLDLSSSSDELETVRSFMPAVLRSHATKAVVAIYTDDPINPDNKLPRQSLQDLLVVGLAANEIDVLDVFLVQGGQYRSYAEPDKAIDLPTDTVPLMRDASYDSREALVKSVTPDPTEAKRVRAYVDAVLGADEPALPDRGEVRRAWDRACEIMQEEGAAQDAIDSRLAVLHIGLRDLQIRDHMLSYAFEPGNQLTKSLPMLKRLAQTASGDCVASSLSVLAFYGYAAGNGSLANTALEIALRADPGYRLALLLSKMLETGANPRHLRECVPDFEEDDIE